MAAVTNTQKTRHHRAELTEREDEKDKGMGKCKQDRNIEQTIMFNRIVKVHVKQGLCERLVFQSA